jgi:alanyl-tRNA synthetase
MGKKDNFWSMGVAGPCGPCSELSVDLGPSFGEASDRGPAGNEERYVEIWNLVFMQNDCNAQIEPIAELPKKNIDTGMGLERMTMVLQNKDTVFETDILRSLIERASELTDSPYGRDERTDVSLRILADHGRSVSFMLADGLLPSNEDRGYVMRLIMRRAIRQARLLGSDGPVLGGLIDATTGLMGDAYPELTTKRDFAVEVAAAEEDRFDATLKQGMTLLGSEIDRLRAGGATELPGDTAFKLHDTWGFPIDMTTEIAAESELSLDRAGFDRLMEEQRTRARSARGDAAGRPADSGAVATILETHGGTEFVGYEHLESDGRVLYVAREGATEGDEVEVVLDRTPFYAEGGGQVGDRGTLSGPWGTAEVVDTQRLLPGLTGHKVRVTSGELTAGVQTQAIVDRAWRTNAERAHTATHILHWILRDRLGEHAHQAGSLVEPGRLRFDFNHFEALDDARLADISSELQERVLTDDNVRAYETTYDFAKSIGAMAFFGEKYGDFVRVVEVGEYSKELCGGTHVPHTARIGVVAVTNEGSVGSNLRRIEALVGDEGLGYLKRKAEALDRVAQMLKSTPDEVAERLERLLATQKEMERTLGALERRSADSAAEELAQSAVDVNGARLIVARRDGDVDSLRSLAQSLKGKLGSAVVVLGTAGEGRANLVGAVSKDLVGRGISARDLLTPGAQLLGGGGGGKPELSISGGPAADKLDEALSAVERAAKDALAR